MTILPFRIKGTQPPIFSSEWLFRDRTAAYDLGFKQGREYARWSNYAKGFTHALLAVFLGLIVVDLVSHVFR